MILEKKSSRVGVEVVHLSRCSQLATAKADKADAEENAALRAQLCEAKAARYGFAPLGTHNPAFAR